MPWDQVMSKWGNGDLRSGSKTGPKVTSQKQAVAIMLSEKDKAKTNPEYQGLGNAVRRGREVIFLAEWLVSVVIVGFFLALASSGRYAMCWISSATGCVSADYRQKYREVPRMVAFRAS